MLSSTGEDGPAPEPCETVADCAPAASSCEVVECNRGACRPKPLPDGPAPNSVPGDCLDTRCVAGELVVTDNPADVDDGQVCTADACTSAGAIHTPIPGEPCTVGLASGICTDDGQCAVECYKTSDCPENPPCQAVFCDANVCVYEDLDEPDPPVEDAPNDCALPACEGGDLVLLPDRADPPLDDDPEDCIQPGCDGTTPAPQPVAIDAACNMGTMVCDGAGSCVECNDASQCDPPEDCRSYDCQGNTCAAVLAAPGDPCLFGLGVCDGTGACVECVEDTHCANPLLPRCGPDNTCVACVDPSDCPAPLPCEIATCEANTCGVEAAPDDTSCGVLMVCCSGVCEPSCP